MDCYVECLRVSPRKLALRKKSSYYLLGFHGGSDGKESACNAGDPDSIPGLGRSPGEGNATHSSTLAWKIPWQRSLVGYSPRSESDMAERFHLLEFREVA